MRANTLGPLVFLFLSLSFAVVVSGGCAREVGGPSADPGNATWVEVAPILRGQCNHCHGSGAGVFGGGYRFDFYEASEATCGPAAAALDENLPLGRGLAQSIWEAITTTSDRPEERPRMPPQPARYLEEWEWQRIGAWVASGASKGSPPVENRPPRIDLQRAADRGGGTIQIDVTVEDPDGDAVIGTLTIGDLVLRMDRAGAFSATLDASGWGDEERPIDVVLCDGWVNVRSVLGTVSLNRSP